MFCRITCRKHITQIDPNFSICLNLRVSWSRLSNLAILLIRNSRSVRSGSDNILGIFYAILSKTLTGTHWHYVGFIFYLRVTRTSFTCRDRFKRI
ncbi:uncharacterized protein M6B38_345395 [Iris pallida]|uniref:Uncharacterized protein n=1 Tax=Iris pallida TaxID=29817 RepID=A0AAX6GE14_IRIPA|nr:uncharacterized protein M6B38_371860 [Iris pallida]KAJ6832068.1 uncharacterized protein M6B38_345395 [Iris pallida]